MDIQAAVTAANRARKAMRHAERQLDEAASDRARARHARRLQNARRALGDARWTFEALACEGLD